LTKARASVTLATETMSGTLTTDTEPALAELLGTDEPGPTEPRPTRLTIHRTSEQDCRDRQVYFSLDGQRVAELLYGQTFTCDIAPGIHRLRANNTLVWKTVEFLAPAGGHVHLTCINYAPKGMFYVLALFGVAPLLVALKPGLPQFVRI
jgi:hypothetical protein